MSNIPNDPGHGDSPAAWTAVTIMLIATLVGSIFFFLENAVVVWICAGVALLGLIIGWVMAKLGFGVNGPRWTPKNHH